MISSMRMGSGKEIAERMKKIQEEHMKIVEKMKDIKYKLIVLSVKGGVGKSFITASLAAALAYEGRRVAVFDADIHGPSIPQMLGVEGSSMMLSEEGLIPVVAPLNIKVVSMSFLLPSEDTPVIWRGPLKSSAIRQLLAETVWGTLDYLLIDLPPGTGDEQLSIAQMIPGITGAIIVTIPSLVSEKIVKKAITFTKRINVPIIGVIENMSYFECPDGSIHYIFGKGAGEHLARDYNIEFLGGIPIDPRVREANDKGKIFFLEYPDSKATKAFTEIARKIIAKIEKAG